MKRFFSLMLVAVAAISMAKADQLVVDCGGQATITATPETGYHFVRWNDDNTENPRVITPTADATYTAYFAINQYTIIFQNYDGTELQNEVLNHGDAVSYKGATPTKPATDQYTYTFSGWSPNVVYTAVDNATYVAQFDATVNKYTITFKNWDGSVLESKQWEYGETPSYTGTPTRPADAENTYTFTGWDKTISVVTGEEEYIAQYGSTTNSYTITTNGENGVTTGDGTYLYGTNVTLTATPNACYRFVRWNDGDTNATRSVTVTGAATYTAIFEKVKYTITVQSDNDAQGSATITAYP